MQSLKKAATLLLLGAGLPGFLGATTLLRMSTEQLVSEASDIVVGTCTATRSVWVDRNLVTLVTISVSESLKGDAAEEITLMLPGGVDASRPVPVAILYPGVPVLSPSDEIVLFAEEVNGTHHVVGFSQGMFAIARDSAGLATATRSRGLERQSQRLDTLRQEIEAILEAQGGAENE